MDALIYAWIERKIGIVLGPLAKMLAEKHLEQPPDSLKLVMDSMEQLQPRGKVTVEINVPHSAPPVITTGPTPYERQKAQEDAWE